MVKAETALKSRLIDAQVEHQRLREGQNHAFDYHVFYALIDLDELDELDRRLWSFSQKGRSIYSLSAEDFIHCGKASIRENIKQWLKEQGRNFEIKSIQVLAHLRSFGFNFNPLAVIFVETEQGTYCLAEVNNTFGEAKIYDLGFLNERGRLLRRVPKNYYVSPFIEHDCDFIFDIRRSEQEVLLQVTTVKANEVILVAKMQGKLTALTDQKLLGYLFSMPMIPVKVWSAIHWHALRLWLKKVPFLRKQQSSDLQRDYYVRKDLKQHIT